VVPKFGFLFDKQLSQVEADNRKTMQLQLRMLQAAAPMFKGVSSI
jgi:hypothetical protein